VASNAHYQSPTNHLEHRLVPNRPTNRLPTTPNDHHLLRSPTQKGGQIMTTKILDPASSMRSFYFDKTDPRVTFGDIREDETHLLTNGQTIHIKPDMVMDFRNLPFDNNQFDLVIFDPPHLPGLSEKSWIRKKYGVLDKETWREDIRKGFKECFRVLRTNGTLVFKWNEFSIPTSEVIKLAPVAPVIGHPSGKRMQTHWLLFVKDN
jgi:SAM-dependent methyltransferase